MQVIKSIIPAVSAIAALAVAGGLPRLQAFVAFGLEELAVAHRLLETLPSTKVILDDVEIEVALAQAATPWWVCQAVPVRGGHSSFPGIIDLITCTSAGPPQPNSV